MNALHGKCHTLEERQPSGARFPLICMFVFRSAPVLYRGVRDAIVFLRALFFGRLSFDDRSLFYARLLFGLLLPYAQSFQRVAYSAARACFPMCALAPGVDLWLFTFGDRLLLVAFLSSGVRTCYLSHFVERSSSGDILPYDRSFG